MCTIYLIQVLPLAFGRCWWGFGFRDFFQSFMRPTFDPLILWLQTGLVTLTWPKITLWLTAESDPLRDGAFTWPFMVGQVFHLLTSWGCTPAGHPWTPDLAPTNAIIETPYFFRGWQGGACFLGFLLLGVWPMSPVWMLMRKCWGLALSHPKYRLEADTHEFVGTIWFVEGETQYFNKIDKQVLWNQHFQINMYSQLKPEPSWIFILKKNT